MLPILLYCCEIPVNVAVENDRLQTGDNITYSDSEIEQNDVASDENIVSESDSDDNWTFIIGVCHEFKRYFMQWTLKRITYSLGMD